MIVPPAPGFGRYRVFLNGFSVDQQTNDPSTGDGRGDEVWARVYVRNRVDLLTEEEYRTLETLGEFDRKTSSRVHTPSTIRALGGALFCDRRYDQVFVYHNGAESYYAARGFRGQLRV